MPSLLHVSPLGLISRVPLKHKCLPSFSHPPPPLNSTVFVLGFFFAVCLVSGDGVGTGVFISIFSFPFWLLLLNDVHGSPGTRSVDGFQWQGGKTGGQWQERFPKGAPTEQLDLDWNQMPPCVCVYLDSGFVQPLMDIQTALDGETKPTREERKRSPLAQKNRFHTVGVAVMGLHQQTPCKSSACL